MFSALNSAAVQQKGGKLAVVNLGVAGNFVILAETGISTTGTTLITGDIGVSPYAATAITGFGLIMDVSNTFSTSSLVNGSVYAADYTPPTPATMTTAVSDMQTAYTTANGLAPDVTEFNGNILDQTAIVLQTGATLNGRALAQTAVTLDANTVTQPYEQGHKKLKKSK